MQQQQFEWEQSWLQDEVHCTMWRWPADRMQSNRRNVAAEKMLVWWPCEQMDGQMLGRGSWRHRWRSAVWSPDAAGAAKEAAVLEEWTTRRESVQPVQM